VLATGAQTLSVTFTPPTRDYNTATQTAQLTVNPVAPAIAFSVGNQTYGIAPFTVAATSNSAGAITYSVVSGPATIAGSTVTITGAGTVVLQASQAASGNYAAGTQTPRSRLQPKRRRSRLRYLPNLRRCAVHSLGKLELIGRVHLLGGLRSGDDLRLDRDSHGCGDCRSAGITGGQRQLRGGHARRAVHRRCGNADYHVRRLQSDVRSFPVRGHGDLELRWSDHVFRGLRPSHYLRLDGDDHRCGDCCPASLAGS